MKEKKVLFVIPYMHEGGAEKVLSTIENNFSDDWEIHTLVNSTLDQAYPVKGKIISLCIDEEPKTASVWFQFKVFLKRVKKLRELKKNGNYDSCISFMDGANIANILSGNKYCKTVLSVHASLVKSSIEPQYKYVVVPLVRLFYNKADKIVVVSDGSRDELVDEMKIKSNLIEVIYNGIDLNELNEKKNEIIEDDFNKFINGAVVYSNVGRLDYPKGQWHLIKAFSELVKKIPNAVLVIIGSGDYRNKLEEIVSYYNLKDKVYFTGFVTNPYKYLKYSDIFVFPSVHEGYPVALAEALCMGLPCVASDFQTGAREILEPSLVGSDEIVDNIREAKNGLMVPVCESSIDDYKIIENKELILAKAMINMAENDKLRAHYIERAKEVTKNLSIENTIGKWMKVAEGK